MNEKLQSPLLKERSKKLDALHAKLKAAEQEMVDCRHQIEMTKALPTNLEVGTLLLVRNLRDPLGPEMEQYKGRIVVITKVEENYCESGVMVHFSYLGMPVPEALDLSWFEDLEAE